MLNCGYCEVCKQLLICQDEKSLENRIKVHTRHTHPNIDSISKSTMSIRDFVGMGYSLDSGYTKMQPESECRSLPKYGPTFLFSKTNGERAVYFSTLHGPRYEKKFRKQCSLMVQVVTLLHLYGLEEDEMMNGWCNMLHSYINRIPSGEYCIDDVKINICNEYGKEFVFSISGGVSSKKNLKTVCCDSDDRAFYFKFV